MTRAVFFVSFALLAYAYFLYPAALAALARLVPRRRAVPGVPPRFSVSLLVPAYNEESVIAEKLENSLALDYAGGVEVIVGVDGSTDATAAIARSYGGGPRPLSVLEFSPRAGKPSALNRMVPASTGSILVFSDADALLSKDTLDRLIAPFADASIGCVSANVALRGCYYEPGESAYWKYELWIKGMESLTGAALGASGGLFAIRRELWKEIPPGTILDDFVIAMNVAEKGFGVIYEPGAVFEELACSTEQEFGRRVRISAGGFQAIVALRRLLDPRRGLLAWKFWSHKVLRWLTPFLLIALFASSAALAPSGAGYLAVFALQVLFYASAVFGYWTRHTVWPFGVAHHFVVMNAAFFVGFFYYIFGIQKVTWQKARP